LQNLLQNKCTIIQGWARDINGRDRDEIEALASRDRDEGETLASTAETRPRPQPCHNKVIGKMRNAEGIKRKLVRNGG